MPHYQHLLLAIPTTSQSMKSATGIAIANAVKALQSSGVAVDLHNIDSAEIVTARDMFANMVLHSAEWDGLLFIDSDMGFEPSLILKIVQFGADVAAAAYPKRMFNLDRFLASAQTHGNRRRAVAEASDFTLKATWDDKAQAEMETKAGFCSMAAVGMGCALISKAALLAMIEHKRVRPRLDLHAANGLTCWSFFDNIKHEGVRLGEDYSFCFRWTKQMGRQLWVCVDEEVRHIGNYEYTASFGELISAI